MRKVFYIQIDNNSLPEGCGEDIEVLDCRCINDLCSLVGDALVGDLKDENGKPLYRLITPVGKLLMDFKNVDENSFDSILGEWYDILGKLLHRGIQEDDIEIKFPQQYVDWLLRNDNPYYEQIGKELQKAIGKITLSSEAIDDDIIASINYKVSHKLQEKKEDFSFAVFSNPMIGNGSFVVKRVKLDGIEFIRYDSWIDSVISQQREMEADEPAEKVDKCIKVKDVSFKMVFVKGGTFTMGATYEQGSSAESRERPNHIVTLSDYFIGETVVTQALWESVMGSNPSRSKGLNYPVLSVSWYEVQEFLNKLNVITGYNFRLPTEAEWEFAARGGIKSKNYKYAGSNDIREVGWTNLKEEEGPRPVAQKKPNELGLYDMSGNVGEWCQDWYSKYESYNQINPVGPSLGDRKVSRGGWWNVSDNVSRVSNRRKDDPKYAFFSIGFRLALNSNQPGGTEMNDKKHENIQLSGVSNSVSDPERCRGYNGTSVSQAISDSSFKAEWDPYTDSFGMY